MYVSVRGTCNLDPPGKNMPVRRTDRPSWKKIYLFDEQIDPLGKLKKGCSWKKRTDNLKNRLSGCFCIH